MIKLFKQVYPDKLFVLTYDNNYTFTQHFGNTLKTESIKNCLKKIEED